MDDSSVTKLNLSITKIDEEKDEDRVQIISLSSPMRVRSPLGYRPSYNIATIQANELNAPSKAAPVDLSVANIRTISNPFPHAEPSTQDLRKTSLLSLKSLSMSLRLLKNRGRSDSIEHAEPSTTLETIDETSRKSIFKMDLFEKNLKKFTSKSNEADFHTYAEYTQNQQNTQTKPKNYFKNQKIYARRSSTSDINDPTKTVHPKLQNQGGMSTSSTNVKHDEKHENKAHHDRHHEKKKGKEEKKSADKTAEMLQEVRKRNLETSKRISAPRRISTY